jgi:hypothetical protein
MVVMMIYIRSQGLIRQTLTLVLKSKHSRIARNNMRGIASSSAWPCTRLYTPGIHYSCYRNHKPKAAAALVKVVLSPVRLSLSLSLTSDYFSLYDAAHVIQGVKV